MSFISGLKRKDIHITFLYMLHIYKTTGMKCHILPKTSQDIIHN